MLLAGLEYAMRIREDEAMAAASVDVQNSAAKAVDREDLEAKVKDMYRNVATDPHGDFHFELGRPLTERLGYAPEDLDRIPAEAIDSFAGVGYYFHLADLKAGESVLDLGSGSGTDTFVAALKVGPDGRVVGVDTTDEQRAKAERLRDASGFANVSYLKGYIEALPVDDASFDAVISNGVINLSPDKAKVFRDVARVLKPGGASGHLRHRDRGAAIGRHRLRRHPVGGVHRRRHATGRLWRRHRGGGLARGQPRGQHPVPVPHRKRPRRKQEIRRQERLGAGGQTVDLVL